MAEINRVYTAVEAFFDSSGIEKIEELADILGKTIRKAERRLCERARDYEEADWNAQRDRIKAAEANLKSAVENLDPKDKEANIKSFQRVTKEVMMVRRAGYPLNNPEASYLPDLTPEEAIMSDSDSYSFAIFDTLSEEIQFILPALFGLAMEGDTFEGVEPPV